ncbi:oxidoreductase domain protein, partial [Nannochloropsis gaditana CCMP526]|uniref:oxidoreductase domain protein n=1 Tax=Nannochloropsis gaditana (strain CCMP526) TaxID=1093141 RepID=UPI00029F675A
MRFHTFARVATGLNTWEREELQNLLKAHWIEGGPGREFPPWIMPWKTATVDIPALWLDVRHAPMVVMSVKGAEMVPSRSYSVEWTLRFPRITRLRPDKALAGVMTVQELQALRERPGGLWGRQDGHAAKGGEKRGRGQGKEGGRKRRARWVPVSAYANPGGMVEAEVKGSLFAGMKICLYGSKFTTRLPNARAIVGLEEGGKEGGKEGVRESGKEGVRESGKEGWFSLEELHRVIVEQGGQASTNLMEIEKGPWDGGEGGEEEAGGVEGGRGGDPAVTSEGNRHPNPPFVSPVYGMDIQRSPSPGISKSPPQPRRYEQDVLLVPAGRPCLRTQAAMREARIDILVVDWMVECLGAGRRIEPRYEHYVGMARGTRRRMEAGYAILGSASIARKLWKAMFMSGNSRVVCVASRDTARAQAFIDECQALLPFPQAPEAVEGYEAALARDDVQCVYIPLPTALRKEWVLKAAASGKHVLVEKPVGLNTEDVQEMIQACIKHNVHLMDGVMFMHSARLQLLQKTLPSLGPLHRINSEFCFKANEAFFQSNIRCSSATEPLGCLGDLGWYNIRLTLWAMNWYLPVRARGCVLKENADGVPYEFSGELLFESGCSATFFCSFLTHETQLAVLNGEEASVQYSDFVLPLPGRYLYFDVNHQSYQQEGLDQ